MYDQAYQKSSKIEVQARGKIKFDERGYVVGADDGAEDVYGADVDSLIGTFWKDLIPEAFAHIEDAFFKSIRGNGKPGIMEIQRFDGQRARIYFEPIGSTGDEAQTFTVAITEGPYYPETGGCESGKLDGMTDAEAAEVAKNIRIKCGAETVTAAELTADLLEARRDLKHYRKGAKRILNCLEVRLEEERKRNPNSDETRVLETVQDHAKEVVKDSK